MRLLAAIILSTLFLVSPAQAEPVNWLMPAYPPAYIPEHGETDRRWVGGGFAEQIQTWFTGHTTGYESEPIDASMSRIMSLMQSPGDKIYCLATTNPTESRATFMAFSAPLYLQPSNRVIVRTDRLALVAPYLDAAGVIDLPALLRDPKAAGSVASGRVYSNRIDSALALAPDVDRQSSIQTPPKLLLAGRADWIVAYPREIEWAWRAGGGDAAAETRPYRTYAIAGEPPFIPSHIGCSKNAAGKRFIDQVDKAIAANPARPWRLYMLAWLDREDRTAVEAAEPAGTR